MKVLKKIIISILAILAADAAVMLVLYAFDVDVSSSDVSRILFVLTLARTRLLISVVAFVAMMIYIIIAAWKEL